MMSTSQEYLKILGALSASIFAQAKPDTIFSDEFCLEIHRFHADAYFYYFAHNQLSDHWKSRFRKQFLYQAIQEKKLHNEKLQLEKELSSCNIRFAWLKGADFAYELYTVPAVRLYGDLDLWFHPEDMQRGLQCLLQNHWIPRKFGSASHHTVPYYRNNVMLEPHYTLPNFPDVTPSDLWKECILQPNGIYRLSPELNLLLIMQHAAGGFWKKVLLHRILADSALLADKFIIHWDKVYSLADQWTLFRPDLLFLAFPEFFPSSLRPAQNVSDKLIREARIFFLQVPFHTEKQDPADPLIQSNKFTREWWKIRFNMLHYEHIKVKYKTSRLWSLQVLILYIQDISYKITAVIRFYMNQSKYYEGIKFMKDQKSLHKSIQAECFAKKNNKKV